MFTNAHYKCTVAELETEYASDLSEKRFNYCFKNKFYFLIENLYFLVTVFQ